MKHRIEWNVLGVTSDYLSPGARIDPSGPTLTVWPWWLISRSVSSSKSDLWKNIRPWSFEIMVPVLFYPGEGGAGNYKYKCKKFIKANTGRKKSTFVKNMQFLPSSVPVSAPFSILIPLRIISSFFCLVKVLKLGM